MTEQGTDPAPRYIKLPRTAGRRLTEADPQTRREFQRRVNIGEDERRVASELGLCDDCEEALAWARSADDRPDPHSVPGDQALALVVPMQEADEVAGQHARSIGPRIHQLLIERGKEGKGGESIMTEEECVKAVKDAFLVGAGWLAKRRAYPYLIDIDKGVLERRRLIAAHEVQAERIKELVRDPLPAPEVRAPDVVVKLLTQQLELLRRTAGAVERLANPMVRATAGERAADSEEVLAWAYGVARSMLSYVEEHEECPGGDEVVPFLRELVDKCEALQ